MATDKVFLGSGVMSVRLLFRESQTAFETQATHHFQKFVSTTRTAFYHQEIVFGWCMDEVREATDNNLIMRIRDDIARIDRSIEQISPFGLCPLCDDCCTDTICRNAVSE